MKLYYLDLVKSFILVFLINLEGDLKLLISEIGRFDDIAPFGEVMDEVFFN